MANLQYYIDCFDHLNCNKQRGEVAPHKAVMLLAVIDEVRLGHITNGFIPHNDRMVEAFSRQWNKYVGASPIFKKSFATPFYHLGYEPFWDLMTHEHFVQHRTYSLTSLRENFYGAVIPEELCDYMQDEVSRNSLIRALVEKYFKNRDTHPSFSISVIDNDVECSNIDTPTILDMAA